MEHSKSYPPSGADRWMVCTASVPLILRLMDAGELNESDLEGEEDITEDDIIDSSPDQYQDVVLGDSDTTSFSAEGVALHTIRDFVLRFGTDPLDYVGLKMSVEGFNFVLDEDMLDRLVEGVDWIRQHTLEPDVEMRLDLSSFIPGFGTSDCNWINDKTQYSSDFKNGAGKPVSPVKNRQQLLYHLGYWDLKGRPKLEKIVINIDQPRAGRMKFWDCSFDYLMQFAEEVKAVHKKIARSDVEFVPTSLGCQFCPVKKTQRGCAAYNFWMTSMMGSSLMDPSLTTPSFKDPAQISRASRAYIIQHSAAIRSWLSSLYSESLRCAIAGDPDPGMKAIEGQEGNRFFTDTGKAERLLARSLGTRAYKPRAVIGITEIERLIKPGTRKQGDPTTWAALQTLVDRKPGKPKLVPVDHPKPALVVDHEDEFDDL